MKLLSNPGRYDFARHFGGKTFGMNGLVLLGAFVIFAFDFYQNFVTNQETNKIKNFFLI